MQEWQPIFTISTLYVCHHRHTEFTPTKGASTQGYASDLQPYLSCAVSSKLFFKEGPGFNECTEATMRVHARVKWEGVFCLDFLQNIYIIKAWASSKKQVYWVIWITFLSKIIIKKKQLLHVPNIDFRFTQQSYPDTSLNLVFETGPRAWFDSSLTSNQCLPLCLPLQWPPDPTPISDVLSPPLFILLR